MVDIWSVPPQQRLFKRVPIAKCRKHLGLRSLSYVGDRLPDSGDPLSPDAYAEVGAAEAEKANKADEAKHDMTEQEWRAGYYLLGKREDVYRFRARLVAAAAEMMRTPDLSGS